MSDNTLYAAQRAAIAAFDAADPKPADLPSYQSRIEKPIPHVLRHSDGRLWIEVWWEPQSWGYQQPPRFTLYVTVEGQALQLSITEENLATLRADIDKCLETAATVRNEQQAYRDARENYDATVNARNERRRAVVEAATKAWEAANPPQPEDEDEDYDEDDYDYEDEDDQD